MKHTVSTLALALAATLELALCASGAKAQALSDAQFVNGLTLSGGSLDLSAGSDFDRRVGYFSDIYFDPNRNEWWGLSDRGPGGGSLSYETRLQRFTLDIAGSGAISNFQVQQTILFTNAGRSMNGLAPNPSSVLGNAFDPEGVVVNPITGNLLVSDEYGPSLYEFDRQGALVRQFTTPANLVPRSAAGTPNYASDTGNTLGKRSNRGFEGLAISPDGHYAYAMLQSATLGEGGSSGVYNRIVKFDTYTGVSVGQYAYKMDSASNGRGISSLVALGNDKFLVLERNNLGVGVGAALTSGANVGDKAVYQIDLSQASDVSGVLLPASGSAALPAGVVLAAKGAKVIDLDADTLAALGGKTPEKWEGLAIGPRLANGRYLVLAGTDNDYSVTQNSSGTQFDVYFRFSDADPYASSIQCPIGKTTGCVLTSNGSTAALGSDYQLLPGVLHAYTADVAGYVSPVPEPGSLALAVAGLVGMLGWRRRSQFNQGA
jgi:hypothetical protein